MRSIKMSFGLTTLRTKLGWCSSCMEYARCFSLSSNVQQRQYCRGRDTVQSHSKISTKSNAKQVTSGLSGTRSSRKAFPVTDLGRNRTELFTALREVSLLPERPGTQYDMSVVSPKHPTCPPPPRVHAHKAPALVDAAGAVRAPAAFAPCRGHPAGMLAFGISMMLCSPHEDQSSGDHTHCLSQAHCLQQHRHVCLPQRQPIAAHPSLFYIYIILQH